MLSVSRGGPLGRQGTQNQVTEAGVSESSPPPRGRSKKRFSTRYAERQGSAGAPGIRAGHRIFLHKRGELFFGSGVFDLLVLTDKTGSLRQAAITMGMAYSKAWTIVGHAESTLGVDLLHRQVGGPTGGGSALTVDGRDLVARYGSFVDEADAALESLFRKYFSDARYVELPESHEASPEQDASE